MAKKALGITLAAVMQFSPVSSVQKEIGDRKSDPGLFNPLVKSLNETQAVGSITGALGCREGTGCIGTARGSLSLLPSFLQSLPPSFPPSTPPSLHLSVFSSMPSSFLLLLHTTLPPLPASPYPSIPHLSIHPLFPPFILLSFLHSSIFPPSFHPSILPSLQPLFSPPTRPGPFQTGFPIQRGFLHARPIRGIKEQLNLINYLPETFFQSGHCAGAKSLSLHFLCEGGSGQIKPQRPADLHLSLGTLAVRDPAATPWSPRHTPQQMKTILSSSFGRAFTFRKHEGCLPG